MITDNEMVRLFIYTGNDWSTLAGPMRKRIPGAGGMSYFSNLNSQARFGRKLEWEDC
jgi:hypothetical protein